MKENAFKIKVKDEREKPLLTKGKRQKVVRFLISPKKKKVKIEVNNIMNPEKLLWETGIKDWILRFGDSQRLHF